MVKANAARVQFSKTETARWKKKMESIEYRDLSIATTVGETSLRNAILHGFGTEKTRQAINKFFASKKQLA